MVDLALAPGLGTRDLNGSLTQILTTQYGLKAARNRVDFRPCKLTSEVAVMLGVKTGTPGLLVVRTSFADNGAVVEYDREYWRHDAIRIHVDLQVRA